MSQPSTKAEIAGGRLAACPSSPNCVSSQAEPDDEGHVIEALPGGGDTGATLAKLKQIIESMDRTQIVTSEAGYLHAEFTSRIFRWVDDVELLADPKSDTIQVRSASRTGYGDLGANRSRVEELREALAAAGG